MSRICQNLFKELRAYKRSRALAFAFASGLVDAVEDGPKTTREAAAACAMREDWAQCLFRVLADLEVVEEAEGTWRLTRAGRDTVANDALHAFAGYHLHCYEAWLDLPRRCSVRADSIGFHRRATRDTRFVRSYLRSMDAIAQRSLPFLQEQCRLRGAIIDVGAGPSTFCRHLSTAKGCQVTALDLPPIVEEARRLFGHVPSFEWVAIDFREYNPTQKFDGLFCCHLLEYASVSELPAWLNRMAGFLRPGGTAAFVAFLRDAKSDHMEQLNLFELSTGVNGERLGHLCTPDEFREALESAGAGDVACKTLPDGPSYSEYLVTCAWE